MNIQDFIEKIQVEDNNASVLNETYREEQKRKLLLETIPNNKDEEWRFTKLSGIFDKSYILPAINKELDISGIVNIDDYSAVACYKNGHLINIINGVNKEVIIESVGINMPETDILAERFKTQERIFVGLNNYFANTALRIVAKKNANIVKPLLILYVTNRENVINFPKNYIHLESGANISIEEKIVCNSNIYSLTNAINYVELESNAILNYYKVQTGSDICKLFDTTYINQQEHSELNIFTLSLKGSFIRNNLRVSIEGAGANTNLYGLYIPKGTEHIDNLTYVEHAVPYTNSNQLYKGVLNDSATGVFNGKIVVCQDAQKTLAFQNNKNIVLSNLAKVNTKPHLEIYADDVKCSHGATVGLIDENALFYMRSRGISKDEAKQMLVNSFVGEVIDKIKYEPIKNYVNDKIANKI